MYNIQYTANQLPMILKIYNFIFYNIIIIKNLLCIIKLYKFNKIFLKNLDNFIIQKKIFLLIQICL